MAFGGLVTSSSQLSLADLNLQFYFETLINAGFAVYSLIQKSIQKDHVHV